jgi:hypothetical protein
MRQKNQFLIRNDSSKPLTLNIEPEGAHFALAKGDEVSVTEQFTRDPVTLKISDASDGGSIVSIWPGDGDVQMAKDGVDILDLVQETVAV